MLSGEGDLVVEHFTASGTQEGEIFGVPPSGHTVALPGINIWRVRDGRIVERWGRLDELGLLRQLGLVNLHTARKALVSRAPVARAGGRRCRGRLAPHIRIWSQVSPGG